MFVHASFDEEQCIRRELRKNTSKARALASLLVTRVFGHLRRKRRKQYTRNRKNKKLVIGGRSPSTSPSSDPYVLVALLGNLCIYKRGGRKADTCSMACVVYYAIHH